VGEAAFATKAGIHASAILKEPATYEHVSPEKRRQSPTRAGVGPSRQVEPDLRA
jgi:isopropylmalate/homocitrate/citramalate synthase